MDARALLAAGVAAVILTACAPAASSSPTGPAATPAVVATYAGVEFYPACGNEQLEFNGVQWYIDHPELAGADYDANDVFRPLREVRGFGYSRGVGAVVPPGPGDDVGTLTVYSNDTAYWVSDSGDLDAWLTTDVRTYNWVC